MVASVVQIVASFARSALLARAIPVETFGVYGWAGSLASLTSVVANFGMGGAFVHRAPETEDEKTTAAVHFTLQILLSLVWAGALSAWAVFFASGETRTATLVIVWALFVTQMSHTPKLLLARRVVHRRLALLQVIDAVLSSIVAVALAWRGVQLWALLATNVITGLVGIVMLYVYRPVWRPRVLWVPAVVRYFFRFGSKKFLADALLRALDRVDDLWTGSYLGNTAMGFYSRAYTFATYPRKIVAAPVNLVSSGTYAELKGDRKRLSEAFFRVNAFLIRSGFLIAGLLALIAPEFIRIVLTSKWLGMLDAFRLMLVYTMFDPIKVTVAALFVAVGEPQLVVKARTVQLAVLLVGLFALGPSMGISGVALAVDLMLVIGIALLLLRSRAYVDISLRRLLVAPAISLAVGLLAGRAAIELPGVLGSDWRTGSVKAVVFLAVYASGILILERKDLPMLMGMVSAVLPPAISSRMRGRSAREAGNHIGGHAEREAVSASVDESPSS
jgi:O-antigen/teichoic acid export membrane protein